MSEARDECRTCILRGNLEECEKTPCSIHNSWYAQELKRVIQDANEQLRKIIEG